MIPPVVVDTNVLVAGLLTSRQAAPAAVILDAMIDGRLRALLSLDLLTEYRDVLLRPAIARRHGLSAEQVDTVLAEIVGYAMIEPAEVCPVDPPDPDDVHVWALLCARPEALLITGDARLLAAAKDVPDLRERVFEPAEFAERWKDAVES